MKWMLIQLELDQAVTRGKTGALERALRSYVIDRTAADRPQPSCEAERLQVRDVVGTEPSPPILGANQHADFHVGATGHDAFDDAGPDRDAVARFMDRMLKGLSVFPVRRDTTVASNTAPRSE